MLKQTAQLKISAVPINKVLRIFPDFVTQKTYIL